MRKLSLLLLAASLEIAGADPSPSKSAPSASKLRSIGDAPAIELADAITAARDYVRAQKIDVSKDYLQSASFDMVKREWSVVWQRPNTKGGSTEIHVQESGKFEVDYGE
jgi:hypothetical protein